MAAAVSGLSPVIITVRIPIALSSSKRSRMPGLTVSFSRMTPNTRHPAPGARSITTSGVAPSFDTSSTIGVSSNGTWPPSAITNLRTESAAPLRTVRPLVRSIPDMRVCAVNGTSTAPASSITVSPKSRTANSTIERPSGVSSASEETNAASATSAAVTSWTGMNSAA